MNLTDYLINGILIGLVVLQVRGKRLTPFGLLIPLAVVGYVGSGTSEIASALKGLLEQEKLEEASHRVADERWAKVLATGQTVPWDDAKAWLEARSRGEHPHKPVACKLGR